MLSTVTADRLWETLDRPWFHLALILVITLIATWLRLWRLPSLPPGLEYDEAINGLDAIWMLKSRTPYLFVNSLHGREALFLYPAAVFIALLGATPFALRLASVLVGILAIPLLYRLTLTLFRRDPQRYWLALVATAGLAVSLWHVSMSRVGLRVVLIPTCFTLVAYLFWRGWQTQSTGQLKQAYGYFIGAGIALGLSQYAYLSARLFPPVILLWAVGVWLAKRSKQADRSRGLWLGLLVTGAVSALVFAPMAILFWTNPAAFGQRATQVTFGIQWTAEGMVALIQHVGQAFSLFLGGSDPRIRHHLVERPVFDWLTLIAFWTGVVVAVRQWRKPAFLFLLLSVFVLGVFHLT